MMHMSAKIFVDTNVVLYLLSDDVAKAATAELIIARRPHISVQVLNEASSIASRKLGMPLDEVMEFSDALRRLCIVEDITTDHHVLALSLIRRYQFSMYDALIVAAALIAGCTNLYTEDLQHNMKVLKHLRIVNPFRV